MSYSATTLFGDRLADRLQPWLDAPGDLERLADSIGQMFQSILELAEEQGEDGTPGYVPAWGKLLDPVNCPGPDLRYLGQYVGVTVPKGASEAEARALVKAEAGQARGTRKSIEGAIERVLGVGVPFLLQERTAANGTEAAYHFNVIVGTGHSSVALREAIEEQKPGGVLFTIIEGKGMWLQATKTWSAVGAGVKWPEAEGNT